VPRGKGIAGRDQGVSASRLTHNAILATNCNRPCGSQSKTCGSPGLPDSMIAAGRSGRRSAPIGPTLCPRGGGLMTRTRLSQQDVTQLLGHPSGEARATTAAKIAHDFSTERLGPSERELAPRDFPPHGQGRRGARPRGAGDAPQGKLCSPARGRPQPGARRELGGAARARALGRAHGRRPDSNRPQRGLGKAGGDRRGARPSRRPSQARSSRPTTRTW